MSKHPVVMLPGVSSNDPSYSEDVDGRGRQTCCNCGFASKRIEGDEVSGWDDDGNRLLANYSCRRYAPRPVSLSTKAGSGAMTEWEWPVVSGYSWCGEWVRQ